MKVFSIVSVHPSNKTATSGNGPRGPGWKGGNVAEIGRQIADERNDGNEMRERKKRRRRLGMEVEEDERRYVSFVVATKGPPGSFANRNRRPWSVYEFPQLATGDKQIASYFCIQRLNGRRVWNDAATRYSRLLLAERRARAKNSNA